MRWLIEALYRIHPSCAEPLRRVLCRVGRHEPWCRGRADHRPDLLWDARW